MLVFIGLGLLGQSLGQSLCSLGSVLGVSGVGRILRVAIRWVLLWVCSAGNHRLGISWSIGNRGSGDRSGDHLGHNWLLDHLDWLLHDLLDLHWLLDNLHRLLDNLNRLLDNLHWLLDNLHWLSNLNRLSRLSLNLSLNSLVLHFWDCFLYWNVLSLSFV